MLFTSLHLIICCLFVNVGHSEETKIDSKSATGIKHNCHISGTHVNCTNLRLTVVPDNFPRNITVLDLSHNKIDELNGTISLYQHLLILNISRNFISILQDGCFAGLRNLVHLDLHDNRLTMNGITFPNDIFKPLKALRSLKLNKNNQNITDPQLSYPDYAMSKLTNLTHLHLDGLRNKEFGPGFGFMTLLQDLVIVGPPTGYCHIESFQFNTFTYLSQLRVLKIVFCYINGSLINKKSLMPLKNLEMLDLSNDEFVHFSHLGTALSALGSHNLTHLNIHNVMNPYSSCSIVTNEFVKSLPRSLTHLIASSNGLAIVEPEVFDLMPRKLKYLDLSDNRFTFGSYLKNLSKLESLETLVLNGAIQSYSLPKWYPPDDYSTTFKHSHILLEHIWERFILKLPQNLKTFSMDSAGFNYALTELQIDPNNTLENIILNGNKIQDLKGPITGLYHLKKLSLVDCHIQEIDESFFDHFPALEVLNISTNSFGNTVLKKGSKPIFKYLNNLKELDISFVNMLTIDENAFLGLHSLETLYLQRNGIYYFTVNISHMTKLKYVNFSFTELSFFMPSVRDVFDSVSKTHNLTIDFSESPIHCYCANLDFITWFTAAMKYIHFINLDRYKCVFEDISEKYENHFDLVYRKLNRQCVSNVSIFIIVAACTLVVIGAIIVLVTYRFRWKIKYLYYSAYLYLKTKRHDKSFTQAYKSDVFVSFANEDDQFVHETLIPELRLRGLKVHTHTLDFIAGEFITTNIVNAVQSSRKTLIVLSHHLIKSMWCKFELQMANVESMHTGRQVMVFLLMEQLPQEEMDRELLYHIQNNTYMQLPQNFDDVRAMDNFWTKLCKDLSE